MSVQTLLWEAPGVLVTGSFFSFSNLFSGDRPGELGAGHHYLNKNYTGSEESVGPALSNMRTRSNTERRGRGSDLFDGDTM